MQFTYKQLVSINQPINALRNAKPDIQDKIDIKMFLKDLEMRAKPLDEKGQELRKALQEAIKDCQDDEQKEIVYRTNEKHLNELGDTIIELPEFKLEWMKYCDLTVQQEIDLESIIKP
jgi:hypothetical protein